MRNSGKAGLFVEDDLDYHTILIIKRGYTDAANHIVSDEYDSASPTWQKNYEIGRLYAVEIMALGFDCPPWITWNFPSALVNIIQAIQEHYKYDIVPASIKKTD